MGRFDICTLRFRFPLTRLPLFALVSLVFQVCCAYAQVPMQVEWKTGRLSVSSNGTPLVQILQEVARQTEMKVEGLEKLQEPMFVHFTVLPLSDGLQKLLARVDYAMSVPDDARRASLLILGPASARRLNRTTSQDLIKNKAMEVSENSTEAQNEPVSTTSDASIDHPQEAPPDSGQSSEDDDARKLAAIQAAVRERDFGALRDEIMSADPNTQGTAFEALSQLDPGGAVDAIVSAAKSGDSTLRVQAIQLLGATAADESEAVFATLGDELKDKDPTVRAAAIQALATRGGDTAMHLLLGALQDPEPPVRMLVIQSVAQSEEGRPLLEKATLDPDESVRLSASTWLEQADSEGR
jgi:hypothetical protein